MRKFFCLAIIYVLMVFAPLGAFAGYELYENFNSGVINRKLWEIRDTSANIMVENGRVKFGCLDNFPNQPFWLEIKKNTKPSKESGQQYM